MGKENPSREWSGAIGRVEKSPSLRADLGLIKGLPHSWPGLPTMDQCMLCLPLLLLVNGSVHCAYVASVPPFKLGGEEEGGRSWVFWFTAY